MKKTENWKQYFDKKGNLKDYRPLDYDEWNKFKETYNLSDDFVDFIKSCIKIKPEERHNVDQLLNHKWLSTINVQ